MGKGTALVAALLWLAPICQAAGGEADVVKVVVRQEGDGRYGFAVTVRHADSGWKHYADRWEVVGPDGSVLASRVLAHPHEHEQPFTRSLSGVAIPAEIRRVRIRAHDLVHGFGGEEVQGRIAASVACGAKNLANGGKSVNTDHRRGSAARGLTRHLGQSEWRGPKRAKSRDHPNQNNTKIRFATHRGGTTHGRIYQYRQPGRRLHLGAGDVDPAARDRVLSDPGTQGHDLPPHRLRVPHAVARAKARRGPRRPDFAVQRIVHRPGGDGRHRQHRRGRHRDLSGRPGRGLLDVGDRPGRHGNQIRRGGSWRSNTARSTRSAIMSAGRCTTSRTASARTGSGSASSSRFFGTFAAFGIGNAIQANSVAQAANDHFDDSRCWLTAVVLSRADRSWSSSAASSVWVRSPARLVPLMAILYVAGALIIIFANIDKLPGALGLIVSDAFTGTAADRRVSQVRPS